MRPLLKVMLTLGAIFATTFVLGRVFGILTVENVRTWLEAVQAANPVWVAVLVIGLLFIDIFVAVPTLTITILAGFFLGFPFGFASALVGMSAAAIFGYAFSRLWGEGAVKFLVKNETDRTSLIDSFHTSGPMMIMLSRAMPILPEVTACMAGVTRMAFLRYLVFFMFSTVPYAAIASYAGSISSIDSPQPAIFAVIFLYAVLWIGWWLFQRKTKVQSKSL